MKQSKATTFVIVSLAIIGFIAFIAVSFIGNDENDGDVVQLTNIRYEISKAEAAKHAEDFIYDEYSLTPSETLVMMQSHVELHGYVQKYDLLHQIDEDWLEETPIDYYAVEVKTEEGPTYLVQIHPDNGTTLGWKNISSSSKAAPDGEQIARSFLETKGIEISEWTSVPNDRAGEYVFAAPDVPIDGVGQHLVVAIEDGKVVSMTYKFIVPEAYLSWIDGQDASSNLMYWLTVLCNVLFLVSAIVIAVIYREHMSFTRGILLTLTFLAIMMMNNLNLYPAIRAVVTSEAESMFAMTFSQIIAFVMAALVYISLVAGDGIWRKMGRSLWARFREEDYGKHILRSIGYGYLFCIFLIGLQQVLFWMIDRNVDTIAVNDPTFLNMNQLWPLLAPLLAWAAAISEEAIFRLFGIGLFKRWFKSSAVAAIVTSFIWAIGHTNYPIYPVYTRLIEVAIIGLIFAFIFLKFGFITAVFAHASFNSILMGISLMVTVTGAQSWLGLVYMASPAIIGFILYYLHKFIWKPAPPADPALPHLNT